MGQTPPPTLDSSLSERLLKAWVWEGECGCGICCLPLILLWVLQVVLCTWGLSLSLASPDYLSCQESKNLRLDPWSKLPSDHLVHRSESHSGLCVLSPNVFNHREVVSLVH